MNNIALLDAIVTAGLALSKAEARRLVVSGNVLVNDTKTKNADTQVTTGDVIKVGKTHTTKV